ncbi:DNA (Cytosine-5)-methyltransferase DRM1/2 isoform 2 [Hibiscus syriacus]|uniref:DNA (Cytosine-5)-methyltransferase DRM1/2 isoform 2 n=1 Tax=Hibiscus syriacus TaxID=106335 RepID=A0A6A2YCS4_HIBSY|nr:DNA (Cytosine-5)-methyltransferase DRM1/2 isoform 2 [Hibiscus syriacus]
MPHMDLSERTFKMPQHLLIQMLKVCSTLFLVEMSLQECPNIHIVVSLQNAPIFYFWLKLALKMSHMDLSDLGLQNLKPLEKSASTQHVDSDNYSSDYEAIFQDDFTDIDSSSDTEEILNSNSDEGNKLLYLTKMGYSEAEALIVMERCGLDSSIAELKDFICAAQMAKAADALLPKQRKLEKKLINEDDHVVHLLNPMIGFGVLTIPDQITQRTLPEDAIGPPYFYYENVALSPVGVWTKMSRDMFPGGINVLSLFSGINGAEVAFYLSWHTFENRCARTEWHTSVESIPILFKFNNLLNDIMDIILTRKMIDIEEVAMMYQDLSQYHGITGVKVMTCSFP